MKPSTNLYETKMLIECKINRKPWKFEYDIGNPVTIIPPEYLNQFNLQIQLQKTCAQTLWFSTSYDFP